MVPALTMLKRCREGTGFRCLAISEEMRHSSDFERLRGGWRNSVFYEFCLSITKMVCGDWCNLFGETIVESTFFGLQKVSSIAWWSAVPKWKCRTFVRVAERASVYFMKTCIILPAII